MNTSQCISTFQHNTLTWGIIRSIGKPKRIQMHTIESNYCCETKKKTREKSISQGKRKNKEGNWHFAYIICLLAANVECKKWELVGVKCDDIKI